MKMDRDRDRRYGGTRDRVRPRDRAHDHYDEGTTYHTDRPGGESYRPGGAPRARSRTPRCNTYRRRSRSPHDDQDRYRDRDRRDNFTGRDMDRSRSRDRSRKRRRSPPRRGHTPRREREENNYRPARSPLRDPRYTRSPRIDRERTPMSAKWSRDGSPADRHTARSPPPQRERPSSPRQRYQRFGNTADSCIASRREETNASESTSPKRAYSPARDRYRNKEYNYRPRSRSPRREPAALDRCNRPSPSPRQVSAPESGATSRRSSPPAHPNRLRQLPDRRRAEDDGLLYAPSPRDSNGPLPENDAAPPLGPKNLSRAPPAGPASSRTFSSSVLTAPTGPATSAARSGATLVFNTPSRPRGGFNLPRGGYGGYQREYLAPRRSSEFQSAPRALFAGGPPTGPRAASAIPPSGPAVYRTNASAIHATPTTYQQRPQRFVSDIPTLIAGGRHRLSKALPNAEKTKKLDVEAERLRRQIEDAEADKRLRLREWERIRCEAEGAKLGTELAMERLKVLEMDNLM